MKSGSASIGSPGGRRAGAHHNSPPAAMRSSGELRRDKRFANTAFSAYQDRRPSSRLDSIAQRTQLLQRVFSAPDARALKERRPPASRGGCSGAPRQNSSKSIRDLVSAPEALLGIFGEQSKKDP